LRYKLKIAYEKKPGSASMFPAAAAVSERRNEIGASEMIASEILDTT